MVNCSYCGGDIFDHDGHNNDYICMSCGTIVSSDDWVEVSTQVREAYRVWDELQRNPSLPTKKERKLSYVRQVHINERISAHIREDPDVPEEHFAIIQTYHEKLCSQSFWYSKAVNGGSTFKKKEIQQLLRFVEKAEHQRNCPDLTACKVTKELMSAIKDKSVKKKYECKGEFKYCRLYLEKWNSLVFKLSGYEHCPYTPEEAIKVGAEFMLFSNLWDELQPPSTADTRENWKWPDRKHFPCINYCMRLIHRYLDLPTSYDSCFPIPTTPSSLEKLAVYYKEMCKTLDKPFVAVTGSRKFERAPSKKNQNNTLDSYKFTKKRVISNVPTTPKNKCAKLSKDVPITAFFPTTNQHTSHNGSDSSFLENLLFGGGESNIDAESLSKIPDFIEAEIPQGTCNFA